MRVERGEGVVEEKGGFSTNVVFKLITQLSLHTTPPLTAHSAQCVRAFSAHRVGQVGWVWDGGTRDSRRGARLCIFVFRIRSY